MKKIVLEASVLGKTVYRHFPLAQNGIIKEVNAFTKDLETEMIVGAWKELYSKKGTVRNLDLEPDVAINDFLYCESCIIDADAKNLGLEVERKVGKYIMALTKEISHLILCMQ